MRDNFLLLIIAIFLIWLGVSPKGRMIYLVLMGREAEIAAMNYSSAGGAGGGFSAGGGKAPGGGGGNAG